MPKVLIIDDDKSIVSMISDFMRINSIDVVTGFTGEDAVRLSEDASIDLIILDINMNGIDGFEACKKIRAHSMVPIIFLTAKTAQSDKILGLGIGADDYLTKPFDPLELVARVKSNIRRSSVYDADSQSSSDLIQIGQITINKSSHKVTKGDLLIDLSATEYTLLLYLIENANRVLNRREILLDVWNSDIYTENTVNTYIMRLREKIEDNKNEPRYLITIRGEGYLFEI